MEPPPQLLLNQSQWTSCPMSLPGGSSVGARRGIVGVRGPRCVGVGALPLPQGGTVTCVTLFPTMSPRGGRGNCSPRPHSDGAQRAEQPARGRKAERGRSAGPARTPCPPNTLTSPAALWPGLTSCLRLLRPELLRELQQGWASKNAGGPALLTRGAPPAARSSPRCPRPSERTVPALCGMGGLFYLDAAWTAGGQPATEARPRPSRGPSCSPPCDFPVSLQRDCSAPCRRRRVFLVLNPPREEKRVINSSGKGLFLLLCHGFGTGAICTR